MARPRLHIICRNCSCNDVFTVEIVPKGHDVCDVESEFKPAVRIFCGNCTTGFSTGCRPYFPAPKVLTSRTPRNLLRLRRSLNK